MRLAASLATVALVAVTFSNQARANGRLPGANQLVIGPHNELALRVTFGILLPDDAGQWRWMCESAIGYGGLQDPAIGIMADKSIIAGLFTGLSHSAVDRCAWTFATSALSQQVVVDVTVRKDDPTSALAMTSTYDGGGGTNPQYKAQLFATSDNAATWKSMGNPLPRNTFVQTLEVAPSRPSRIYVSSTLVLEPLHGVIYATDDSAATWSSADVNLLADMVSGNVEKAIYVAAIDPNRPDRVYARTGGDGASRLLVSDDAGKTWAQRIKLKGQMLGFALSPDGERVYVGGREDGVKVASTSDWQFTQTSTIEIECLTAHPSGLYACSNEANGFLLGLSSDEGKTFKPVLHFSEIAGPVACTTDAGALCSSEWPALRDRLTSPAVPEPGPSDASAVTIPGSEGGSHSACSCDMMGGSSSGASVAVGALLLSVLLRRRRARS
jgi:uncharacterized protein (TIGR03382 family)